jgi:hypothetical protein
MPVNRPKANHVVNARSTRRPQKGSHLPVSPPAALCRNNAAIGRPPAREILLETLILTA